jgi:hypothetical protein
MSTRYSSDYKALVSRLLWMYGGNITLVSHLTSIPERTLRDWRWQAALPAMIRREDSSERREHPAPPPLSNTSTAADDFDLLRQRLMQQAMSLATSLTDDAEVAPLHQRALALSRLIDRIVKLDTHADSDYIEMMPLPYDVEETDDEDEEEGSFFAPGSHAGYADEM